MQPIVDKAPENSTGTKPISATSNFDYNYNLAGGYRFGELGVCQVQDYNPDEELPLQSGHTVRSMNLKAPLMGSIKLHKEFFDVPFPVLLPLNYDKFYTQPLIGEDIDASEVGLNVQGFDFFLKAIFEKWWTSISTKVSDDGTWSHLSLESLIRFFLCAERFYSKGNLLHSLGIQLGKQFSLVQVGASGDPTGKTYSFDYLFQNFFSSFFTYLRGGNSSMNPFFEIDTHIYRVKDFSNHEILERLRDASIFELDLDGRDFGGFQPFFLLSADWSFYPVSISAPASSSDGKPISLARPMAYQVCCAEFFSNSHVDHMYSAELWRQSLRSFYESCVPSANYGFINDVFSVNGSSYCYDYCSAHNVVGFLTAMCNDIILSDVQEVQMLDWSRLIFGYNRSLRYVDYFTGSRTRPLAVGDVNVQVNGGYVNVVDTIQKRWYAKFLNQVNRFQRRLSDYARALFPGLTMQRDFHSPMWLASIEDDVNSPEIEGTVPSDNMSMSNTTTSVLRSNGDRYCFEYHTQYIGVQIGIIYFDIKRYYQDVIERPVFNVDRNDYFNPYLQFVGDQKVYADELNSKLAHSIIFGYQGRYSELKQRVDYCFGPFADGELPGWLFLSTPPGDRGESFHQSPDFIRSRPSELDEFYSQLDGLSLSKYYHFIIINRNDCHKTSPMVKNPQLD